MYLHSNLHGDLFDGPPPPQARTAPAWPGYDRVPAKPARRGLVARLLRRRRRTRVAAV